MLDFIASLYSNQTQLSKLIYVETYLKKFKMLYAIYRVFKFNLIKTQFYDETYLNFYKVSILLYF